MMRYGIPQYRLPRAVLDAEIRRIEAMGVEIRLNHKVTDLKAELDQGGFQAVFLAVGAHLAKRSWVPAGDANKIVEAYEQKDWGFEFDGQSEEHKHLRVKAFVPNWWRERIEKTKSS